MHREVLGISDNPTLFADHIDPACTLDNRRCNLRLASRSENNANTRRRYDNSSGFKGVYQVGQRWRAMIRHKGTRLSLGTYATKEAAAKAYNNEAKRLFGAFAYLNTIKDNE